MIWGDYDFIDCPEVGSDSEESKMIVIEDTIEEESIAVSKNSVSKKPKVSKSRAMAIMKFDDDIW